MFVKHTGCELEVLYESNDETNTTAFGSYGVPQPTSGTRQGFDISDEGDLYASLTPRPPARTTTARPASRRSIAR